MIYLDIFKIKRTFEHDNTMFIYRLWKLEFNDLQILFFFLSGALFEDGEDSQQAAFMFAVDMTNADRSVLVRTKLVAHPEQIPRGDSFKATKKSKLSNNSVSLEITSS